MKKYLFLSIYVIIVLSCKKENNSTTSSVTNNGINNAIEEEFLKKEPLIYESELIEEHYRGCEGYNNGFGSTSDRYTSTTTIRSSEDSIQYCIDKYIAKNSYIRIDTIENSLPDRDMYGNYNGKYYLVYTYCSSILRIISTKSKPIYWTLRQNKVGEGISISITTPACAKSKNISYHSIDIFRLNNKFYWSMRYNHGLYLSSIQKKAKNLRVSVVIGYEVVNFDLPSSDSLQIPTEILEALKKGTIARFQFDNNPEYYEFNLQGFSESLNLLN